jgi:PKD repeat protein
MPLFTHKFILGFFLVTCLQFLSNAQNCHPPSVFFPDTVCVGQTIRGINTGPSSSTYEWDVCAGDLFRTATAAPITLTGLSGSTYGLEIIEEEGNFYGFSLTNSTNILYRFDFGSNINSNPTVVNLGNPGLILNGAFQIDIKKSKGIYYGFAINRPTNQLVRLKFGNGINSPPTADAQIVTGFSQPLAISIIEDNNRFFGFSPATTINKLFIFDFGDSLSSTPITTSITIPAGGYHSVLPTTDCNGKYVFLGEFSGKFSRVSFGESFLNITPTVTTINIAPTYSGTIGSIIPLNEGGRKTLLIGGASTGILNFGNTYQNNAPGISIAASTISGVYGISENYYLNGEQATFYYTSTGGSMGRITFSNGSCNYSEPKNLYVPPQVTYNSPGKYFINYKIKTLTGQIITVGDSIVVKNGTSLESLSPTVNFVGDDQCTSKPTKFFPDITPNGSYSYSWTFPGPSTSTLANPSFQFLSTGSFPVTLKVRALNGCGVNSITKLVKIFPNPSTTITSSFSAPAQICTKDTVQFFDGSTPANQAIKWLWNFGNGQVFFEKNPKVYFPFNSGGQTIQVSFKASDSSGCATAVVNPITVKAGADVQFSFSKLCKGDSSKFLNTTPNISQASYLWNFGNPQGGAANINTSSAPLINYVFSDSGLYNINLRAITANGCTSSVVKPLRIFTLPAANFSFTSVAFPNIPVSFKNLSSALYQNLVGYKWNFGNPAIPSNDTSSAVNPAHTYPTIGTYTVTLDVTTNQGCKAQKINTIPVYPPCPIINYTKTTSSGINQTTLSINNQTTLVEETNLDFCAGDLELTPVLQSQQSGVTPFAINTASQVIPVKDNGKWIGFIPAPIASNSTCFFKGEFENSLNNDIKFNPELATLQNRFPTPVFIRFIKEDTVWYGIASNGDSKLWRIRFGKSINNNAPTITEIPLPVGTLVFPTSAQIVKDKDTTYIFITNNTPTNNFVKLRFSNSIEELPDINILTNSGVLLNSNGFFNVSFAKDCDKWYALLLATNVLYKLEYGNSLRNTPITTSITSEIPLPGGANAFNLMRGISLMQDMGIWYGFLNTQSGSIIRIRFGNGLNQPINGVSPLGNFGIAGNVGSFNFVQENSEVFGLTINNLGTVYKLKFPNPCSAQPSFTKTSTPGTIQTSYSLPGKYYITITGQTKFGSTTQKLDSIEIAVQNINLSCKKTELNHPEELCFNSKYESSTATEGLNNVKWDFCTGDFKLTPKVLVGATSSQSVSVNGIQNIQIGNTYYTFLSTPFGLFRVNIGEDPAISALPNSLPVIFPLPAGVSGLSEFKIFKEGNNWFALCIYSTGESIIRVNFGADIKNLSPTIAVINLPGSLSSARGLSLFEDKGTKYAMVANQNGGTLVLLNFGVTYRNIPFPTIYDIPGAINLFKVSMIRDCNIWHAFLTDEKQDSLYQLTFNKGFVSNPTFRLLGIIDGIGIQAIKDGNEYFLFATKNQLSKNNLFRYSFGNSLNNIPRLDSLTNFGTLVPNSGLTNVFAFQIFQNDKSENFFFGHGFANQFLYRIKFQDQCSAGKPIALGDTITGQSYSTDGKYYISTEGFNVNGDLVSGFDSVIVKNLVEAKFNIPGNRCKGEPIQFSDASIPGTFTNITSWKWNFGDTTTIADSSILQNPSYTFSNAGVYPVKLRVKENGGCINEITTDVQIVEKPTPKISFQSNSVICTNDSILFQDSTNSAIDPIVSRLWEIKQNNVVVFSSTKKDPRFLFTQTGAYEASLKVIGQSLCENTQRITFTVSSIGPLVTYTNSSPCLNENIPFKSKISGTSIDSLRWFVDAAKVASQDSITYRFTSADVFKVTLVTYKGGCRNSFSKILKVNARPSVAIEFQTPVNCQGIEVKYFTIVNSAESLKYNWDFGNGKKDTLRNPVTTFDSSGTFLVKLNVTTENGCIGKDSSSFTANRAPKAEFSFDKACLGEIMTLENTSTANGLQSGIQSYFWDFGNTETSDQKDPLPIPSLTQTEGVRTIKLTVRTIQGECPNTFIKNIVIGKKLAANFGLDVGCIGTPFRFFDKSFVGTDSIVSWNWTIAGTSYNTRNPILSLEKGSHDVKLIVKSVNGCTDAIENKGFISSVNDSARADFTFSSGTFSEPPFRVAFRQLPKVDPSYTYSWDLGDSTIINDTVPQPHLYKKEGVYLVKLTGTRNGTICSTSVTKVLNVIANPIQGLKLRKLFKGDGSEKLSMALEVENQSNIALRNFDITTKVGSLITIKETWNGILLPQQIITFPLKSDILKRNSQNIQFICATVTLPDPEKETSIEDNSICISVDSIPAIVSLYPNPASDQFTIELNLPTSDPFEMKVVDILGRQIIGFNSDQPEIGAFAKRFDVSKFPGGVYYLWFRSGKKIEHRTLVIDKK